MAQRKTRMKTHVNYTLTKTCECVLQIEYNDKNGFHTYTGIWQKSKEKCASFINTPWSDQH